LDPFFDGNGVASYLNKLKGQHGGCFALSFAILTNWQFESTPYEIIQVSKIQASANKAAKLAREARQYATDDDLAGCSMGDIELYDAVISSCEKAAANPPKGNQQQGNGY